MCTVFTPDVSLSGTIEKIIPQSVFSRFPVYRLENTPEARDNYARNYRVLYVCVRTLSRATAHIYLLRSNSGSDRRTTRNSVSKNAFAYKQLENVNLRFVVTGRAEVIIALSRGEIRLLLLLNSTQSRTMYSTDKGENNESAYSW